MQTRDYEPYDPSAEIVFSWRARRPPDQIGLFRGSHMIRDPRDIAVSAYHYHLWTEEKWVHVPREEYSGRTYQEYLNSLDRSDGLSAEIRRLAAGLFKGMGAWDYAQPEFIELRYEDVIVDPTTWFACVFRHYGFTEEAVENSVAISEKFSFSKVSGRSMGEVDKVSHLRSGRPGQWREEFSAEHVSLFKELTGDLIVRLGYESDDRW